MNNIRTGYLLAVTFVVALAFPGTGGCASGRVTSISEDPPPAAGNLTGSKWLVVELSGHRVATSPQREQPFIIFDEEKRQVAGYTGCNRFFGGYELDGPALTFGPIGSTKRACPDLEEGLETEFFKVLDATRRWAIVDGALRLLNGEAVLARLAKGPGS